MITREAVNECGKEAADRAKVADFDRLAKECMKVKGQIGECETRANVALGERDEARAGERREAKRAYTWQTRAVRAETKLEERWSPATWAGVGAGVALVGLALIRAAVGPL